MTIIFEATLERIGPFTILQIPADSSKKLTSRGIVMVQGTINGVDFKKPLEPDGKGSHWIEIHPLLNKELGVGIGETVSVRMEQTGQWVEPDVPADIMDAVTRKGVSDQWDSLTTRSRWEWIRWIRSTKNEETRKKRIGVACSKLQHGDKNPCCFNASLCTVTEVSKSGVLLGS